MKHIVDKGLEKIASRKLLAWVTATALLAFAELSSEQWGLITIVYISSQAVVDVMERYRKSK